MAITLLRINDQNLMLRTDVLTVDDAEIKICRTSIVNEKLENLAEPTVYQYTDTEEAFHRDIRLKASKKEQLITELSTNPEWNPEGYSKTLLNK